MSFLGVHSRVAAKGLLPAQRWPMLTTLLAFIGFFSAELAAQHLASSTEEQATSIATNAAPGMIHLAGARRELHRISAAAWRAISGVAEPSERRAIELAQKRLHAEIAAYLETPAYPGERDLYQPIAGHIEDLDRVIPRMLVRLDAHDAEGARVIGRTQLMPLVDRAFDDIDRLLDFNGGYAIRLAGEIRDRAHRNAHLSFALHMLAGVLAIILLVLATWAAAAAEREGLARERNRLTEQRAQELERFSLRVSHDLKNPLNSMALRVALAQRSPLDEARGHETLDRLAHNIKGLNQIIDGLLEFSLAGGRPLPGASASLAEALGSVGDMVRPDAEQAGALLDLDPDGSAGARSVACPPGALASILANLLRNALKYLADAQGPERRVSVRVSERPGSLVRIEVEDTGPGIAPGQEADLFTPFYRAKATSHYPGLGLGLATVKRIVEAYGGTVGVRSNWGQGACFWFELPLAPSPSPYDDRR